MDTAAVTGNKWGRCFRGSCCAVSGRL